MILTGLSANGASPLKFAGNTLPAWQENGEAATGLQTIYVLPSTVGVTATYTASSATSDVSVAVWDARGAASATDLPASSISRNGAEVTLTTLEGDRGYTFTENGRPTYYWIVDYEPHRFEAKALAPSAEQECGRAWLDFTGKADAITYHGINGRSWTLSREIDLVFTTLRFDEEAFAYTSDEKALTLDAINNRINIEAPLCDTYFTLAGDRFLRYWGEALEITSSRYTATTVAAEVKATQTGEKPDNQVNVDTDGLGGSAPVEITFSAVVNDAAIFHEWQFSPEADFYDITMRTSQLEFTQTFLDMGTTYVRFITANADATCESESETFKVYVGESFLRCPNAFSPGATEGVNDEWRVSYKSLITFECYIFNKWGQKMAEFKDPAMGWDGRHGGKLVPPGVYYYVIKATGSDGKKYDESGDINIIRYTETE